MMAVDEETGSKFNNARKEVLSKYQDVSSEVNRKIKELLEKTYKQFEETYVANSRKVSDES